MMEYIKLKDVLHILDVVITDDSIKHTGKAIRKRLKELSGEDVVSEEIYEQAKKDQYEKGYEYAIEHLNSNIINVVFCKDCKHRNEKGICEKFRQRYPFYPEDDFHCGYGVKEEGA